MASYHTTDVSKPDRAVRSSNPHSSPLTNAEREVVLSIADDEKHWSVFTDSRRFSGRLKKLAAAWGVAPERLGDGWEFALPLRAIRLSGPRKPRQLSEATRERLRKADFGRRRHATTWTAAGSGASEGF